MRIVHSQTQIQTVFGVLDDDGNVIPQQPIIAQVPVFSEEAFVEAFTAIKAERDKAVAASNGVPEQAEKPDRKSHSRPRR